MTVCLFLFSACGDLQRFTTPEFTTPKCGADETLEVVRQVFERDLKVDSFKMTLVTMIGRDQELDSYDCSAQFEAIQHGELKIVPTWFTVNLLATDPSQMVVQVREKL